METRRLSHQAWKSVQRFDLGACTKKGHDKTDQSQKSQMCYISPTWAEAPTELICTEICTVVVMCAKFWTETFRGYGWLSGTQTQTFQIWTSWTITSGAPCWKGTIDISWSLRRLMTESRPQTIWEELPQEHNNKVVNFIKRLTVCVAASGDHFETICPSASLHPHPITN